MVGTGAASRVPHGFPQLQTPQQEAPAALSGQRCQPKPFIGVLEESEERTCDRMRRRQSGCSS